MKLSPGAEVLSQMIQGLGCHMPSFHVVLGSGFKDSLDEGIPSSYSVKKTIPFSEVPGLASSTAPGHLGQYVLIEHHESKQTGLLQVGRLHGYEGLSPREVTQTVMLSRELGTQFYFITNAAGGAGEGYQPGDVMVIRDQINLTGTNSLVGKNPKQTNGEPWGPRFPDLTKLYDREWGTALKASLEKNKIRVHEGVYIGVLGPAFETPAEIRFFQTIGGHAMGMSTVWESIALHHSGAKVCGLSLISNIAAGLDRDESGEIRELDHFAILDACKSTSVAMVRAIIQGVEERLK